MATPCAIIVRSAAGYLGLACHFDGFLDATGARLVEHFSNPGALKRLLSGGDIAAIGWDGSIRRAGEDPHVAVPCVEARSSPLEGASPEEIARQIYHLYAYVWEGAWKVADWRSRDEFQLMTFDEASAIQHLPSHELLAAPGCAAEDSPKEESRRRGR